MTDGTREVKRHMPKNKWIIKSDADAASPEALELSEKLGITPLTARLLLSRGLSTYEEAYRFLSFADTVIHDPFLLADMDKAVERLEKAIACHEKIVIYGDYDVDGVTSTALLYMYLTDRGADNLSYYIPDRGDEGYGINISAIDRFADDRVNLVVTVDTGVTAIDEVEYARRVGIEFVITDHHECRDMLPDAVAVVNPMRRDECNRYPFRALAGVGVAFKLITAMEMRRVGKENDYLSGICKKYADLVAAGTIADVMPVLDENRLYVSMGIKSMNDDIRPAFGMLIEEATRKSDGKPSADREITSSLISFTLAPRINAAGRMAHASLAVELFLSDDEKKIRETASELCEINRLRQEEENRILQDAVEMIKSHKKADDRIIVIAGENWNSGVIGIVASRITERFGLPSILVSFDGDVGKGSGRSLKGMNLVSALSSCSDILEKFGGHEVAAGITIDRKNFDCFCKRMNEYAAKMWTNSAEDALLEVECEVYPPEMTFEQAKQLRMLEPYGTGNPMPLFLMRRMCVSEIRDLSGKHTKLTVRKGFSTFSVLLFGRKREELDIIRDDDIDVVFQLSINEYRGNCSLQFIAKDWSLSESVVSEEDRGKLSALKNGDRTDDSVLPSRDDFAGVYRYVRHRAACGEPDGLVSVREMLESLGGTGIGYVKLHIIIEILVERGLLICEKGSFDNDIAAFSVNNPNSKVNLFDSPIYKRLAGSCGRSCL